MCLTRGTAASRVRANLDNNEVTFFTALDIQDSLQDGYDEIATATATIEKQYTLTLEANKIYYDLKTLIPDYYYTTKIYYPTIRQFLQLSDSRTLDRLRIDWELWRDNPFFWFPHSWNLIAIVPALSSVVSQTVRVYYKATASSLVADSDVFNIPQEGQFLPENYGTFDLLEQCQEYTKAQTYFKQYQKDLLESLKRLHRALPDSLYKLEG